MQDNNLIIIILIIALLYIILNKKDKKHYKKHSKKHSKKHHKKHSKKHHKKSINEKKKYVINELIKLKSTKESIPSGTKEIYLISAYSSTTHNNNFNEQFESYPKKLYSIDENNIKNNDIIQTNFIEADNKTNLAPAPSPSPNLSLASDASEIIGIVNAPMYAPVESINKLPLDLFLINQINTSKNNSVSFLDQPLKIKNKKIFSNDSSLEEIRKCKSSLSGLDNKYEYSLV